MIDNTTKAIIEYGADRIGDMIANDEAVDRDGLHQRLYNDDYFIIGIYQANGNVYAVYIYDRAGESVDGCSGLYGDYDDLINDAKATIDRLPLIHDAAYAKKAGALHV